MKVLKANLKISLPIAVMQCLVFAGLSSSSLLAVPENVAPQGTIIFVSGSITEKPPSMLIDGISNDSNNRWGSNGMPQTLVIDLGGTFDLSRFEAFPYFSRAYRYTIEGSLDNSTFTTLVDRSQNTTASATIADDIQATSARYVRFKVTGANPASYTGSWVTFLELKCFGTPSLEPTNDDPQIIDSDLLVTGGLRVDAGLDLVTQGLSIFSSEALYSNGTAPSITLGYDLNGNPNFSLFNTDPTSPTASGLLLNPTNSSAEFRNTNVAITGSLSLNGSEVVTSANVSNTLTTQGFLMANPAGGVGIGGGSALGDKSFAGADGVASGPRSISFGYNSSATASDSFAFGISSSAGGYSSLSLGSSSNAVGTHSIALGTNASALALSSAAIGINSLASGDFATTIGAYSEATAKHSSAFGYGASSRSMGEVALGTHNKLSEKINAWRELDAAFRVGNGESPFGRSDAVTTLKNGQTTLSNKAWKQSFVADNETRLKNPPSRADSDGKALVVDGHSLFNGKVVMAAAQGDISMGVYGGEIPTSTLLRGILYPAASNATTSLDIDGVTIVASEIGVQGGEIDNGEFYELVPDGSRIYLGRGVGDSSILSTGRILEITSIGNGVITFIIADQ